MIEIPEAVQLINAHAPAPEAVLLATEAAHTMLLAQDITAREDSPRFDNSAMDGYCLRWQDVQHLATDPGAGLVELTIIGESSAGAPFDGAVLAGTAVRISTGATIPRGGDTVIPQEDCSIGDSVPAKAVKINTVKKAGANIRRQGEEFRAGDTLIKQGTLINSAQIGVLAGQGYPTVAVWRRLRAASIVTGSELVSHWHPGALPVGGLRDSNGPMLTALIQESAAVALPRAQAGDTMAEHTRALEAALDVNADVIIFSGGISVGPHDLVRACAESSGFETIFWRVNQKPGKPLYFAKRGEQLLFGLPGNPVSAHVCFTVYIQPLLRAAAGLPAREPISARAGAPLVNKGRRPVYVRLQLQKSGTEWQAFAASHQGSHMLSGVSRSAGLLLLQPGADIAAGTEILVQEI